MVGPPKQGWLEYLAAYTGLDHASANAPLTILPVVGGITGALPVLYFSAL
jgi:hypothetical protein